MVRLATSVLEGKLPSGIYMRPCLHTCFPGDILLDTVAAQHLTKPGKK